MVRIARDDDKFAILIQHFDLVARVDHCHNFFQKGTAVLCVGKCDNDVVGADVGWQIATDVFKLGTR